MYNYNILELTKISLKQINSLIKSKKFILFCLSFFLVFYLTRKDIYLISRMAGVPVESLNCWHGVFANLINAFIVPMHYWLFFIAFLFYRINDLKQREAIVRYANKRNWFWEKVLLIFIISMMYSAFHTGIIILGNILQYGIDEGISWGQYNITDYSVSKMLLITLSARFFSTATIGFIYLFIYINTRRVSVSTFISFLYVVISIIVFLFTPQQHSFKPFIFPSCTLFGFFLAGSQVESYYTAFVVTIFTSILFLYFGKKNIYKLELID